MKRLEHAELNLKNADEESGLTNSQTIRRNTSSVAKLATASIPNYKKPVLVLKYPKKNE